MKKKDIKLFDKAIHQAKHVATNLVKDVKELKQLIDELYELFDDLSNGKKRKTK